MVSEQRSHSEQPQSPGRRKLITALLGVELLPVAGVPEGSNSRLLWSSQPKVPFEYRLKKNRLRRFCAKATTSFTPSSAGRSTR